MQLSAKTQNACLALLELARRHQDPSPVCLKSIAEAHDISPPFLVQIFQQLKRAGLVKSLRGASGGYRLAKSPGRISLLDVVAAIEGPPVGLGLDAESPLARVLIDRWAMVVGQYEECLAEVSLQTLVDRVQASVAPDMYYI